MPDEINSVPDGAANPSALSHDAMMAKLQSEVKAINPHDAIAAAVEGKDAHQEPPQDAPVEPQKQESAPKGEEPGKADDLKPFRNKEGDVDPQKIEKANESLQKGIKDKESRVQELLKANQELKKQFYAASENAAKLNRENGKLPQEVTQTPEFRSLSPELKKQITTDLANGDPVETIVKLIEMVTDSRIKPVVGDIESFKTERTNRVQAERLDDLGQSGHSWVYTPEGMQWFQERFRDEPALLQMRDPYGAAVRMFPDDLPKSAQPQAQARGFNGTPILGGSSAVPPPSSVQTATPERTLDQLSAAFDKAMASGRMDEVMRIGSEMQKAKEKIRL